MEANLGAAASGTRLVRPRFGCAFDDKIDWKNFERATCDPEGGEQEARNKKKLARSLDISCKVLLSLASETMLQSGNNQTWIPTYIRMTRIKKGRIKRPF